MSAPVPRVVHSGPPGGGGPSARSPVPPPQHDFHDFRDAAHEPGPPLNAPGRRFVVGGDDDLMSSGCCRNASANRLLVGVDRAEDDIVLEHHLAVECADVTCAGALLFALHATGRPATLTWTAVALLGVIIVSSLIVAEPINARFRRVPEGDTPEGAERLRVTWRRFHYSRTLLGVAAFVCIVGAVS